MQKIGGPNHGEGNSVHTTRGSPEEGSEGSVLAMAKTEVTLPENCTTIVEELRELYPVGKLKRQRATETKKYCCKGRKNHESRKAALRIAEVPHVA